MNHEKHEPGHEPEHHAHAETAGGAEGASGTDGTAGDDATAGGTGGPGAAGAAEARQDEGPAQEPATGPGPAPGDNGEPTADGEGSPRAAGGGDGVRAADGGGGPGAAGGEADGPAGADDDASAGAAGVDDVGERAAGGNGGRGTASGPGAGRGTGSGPGGDPGAADDIEDIDEEALRRLLRGAVDDLEPTPGALDHLHRAVPARRRRRRQALVGAVAAVVLGGAALPTLVHVANEVSTSDDRSANAASSERTPGVQGGTHGGGGEDPVTGRPTKTGEKEKDGKEDKEEEGKTEKEKHSESPSSDPGVPNPSSTLNATSPVCTRAQLEGSGAAGPADANGHVYGSFRVVNTSATACTVDGSGAVSAVAQGSADATRINVVYHTPGDAATQLPDTSTSPTQLILQPGQAYEVKFAWLPAADGGPSGCGTSGATPTPEPTEDNGTGSAPQEPPSPDEAGGEAGGGTEQPEASVQVIYTPAAGDPAAATTTVPNACAGTVYHTGVLAG
ncbi:hypothetical protein IHE55_13760 [Streptomyces pactum]|uniref:DUF4232 domain-containing protein n=1 Tax=Streptomyces pactum TaxID=68249 RepID=A0ABS0NKS5_9ACTN|nr:DUF4232 domain-containing protein [Streptomyces pactum]MBH5335802.1 hypothetical protein [Streptomyces pactum]